MKNYLKFILSLIIGISVIFFNGVDFASAGWTEGKYNSAIEFNGETTFVDVGSVGNIRTVSFWVKRSDTSNRDIIDLGVPEIKIDSDAITASGFTSPTYYVDGALGSTIADTGWHYVTITDTADVSADDVDIGKASASFFYGTLDNVQLYAYARTADEIRLDYNAGVATHLGPSGKTCSEDPASCMDYGLVGSWNMDEGTGTTIYDGSDEGNNGAIHGAKWGKGKEGSALQFDGTDDYVDCGNDESLNITDAITIEAWVKLNCPLSSMPATYPGYYGVTDKFAFWWSKTNGTLDFKWKDNLEVWHNTRNNSFTFSENIWYHLVFTYDGEYARGYVDGVEIINENYVGSMLSSNYSIRIGKADNPFNGTIDEVRIYNRTLSAEEIRYHYNRGGPVANWNFDEGSGQTVFDSAGDADGTLGSTTGSDGNDPAWSVP